MGEASDSCDGGPMMAAQCGFVLSSEAESKHSRSWENWGPVRDMFLEEGEAASDRAVS